MEAAFSHRPGEFWGPLGRSEFFYEVGEDVGPLAPILFGMYTDPAFASEVYWESWTSFFLYEAWLL